MTYSPKKTDICVKAFKLYFLPVETRMPLKFGPETLTSVTCLRVKVTVEDATGHRVDGWGETPLSIQWFWPSHSPYAARHQALKEFCQRVAKAHGMPLMVQDLTNPMMAQITHLRLPAHSGTIMGIETNSMQFYPEASLPEALVHPGMYRRRNGVVDLSTLQGSGFGYRVDMMWRELPTAALQVGQQRSRRDSGKEVTVHGTGP